MTEFVDVALTDAVRIPYVQGAQSALAEIDASFAAAWDALAAAFPGISLDPLFDALSVEDIAAITDAARERSGEEPPDLFSSFTIPVDDGLADILATAASELPFILSASRRRRAFPAGPLWGSSAQGEAELQILPPPHGVDAVWAWHVPGGTAPGVRIADVEGAWDLNHEELRGARISIVSVSGTSDIEHGTAVAGIVAGGDDGVGITGIAPGAEFLLVTDFGGVAVANAVLTAIQSVGVDGIVLLEIAAEFNQAGPDVPIEVDPMVQRVIRLAALFGITVVEPAGNGAVDLDASPAFNHFNPLTTTFVDSHAVMVGAGVPLVDTSEAWQRADFSSFGARVDCFGPGEFVRAPGVAPDTYVEFSGTSAASAVIAGVAASIQGMSTADSGQALDVADLRGLLSDPALGTVIPDGQQGGIGSMPDLRKIALSRGWPRIVTPAIVALDASSVLVGFLNTENRLVRRTWHFFLGWDDLDPVPVDSFTRAVTTGRPVVTVRQEQDPLARIVHDAVMVGAPGIEHIWWDDQGQMGNLQPVADRDHVAQGSTIAVVPTAENQLAVASVSPEGRLLAMVGDAGFHLIGGLSIGVPLDPLQRYRRLRGPAIASRTPGAADVVAIDDAGTARWFTGVTDATTGTGFQPGIDDTSGVAFDGGAGVDVVVVGPEGARRLVAHAVGRDGHMRALDIDPAQRGFTSVVLIGPADVSTEGPVAIGIAGERLVALAVNTGGTLLAATRSVDGGPWSQQVVVGDATVMPSAGVVAASVEDIGVMALVVNIKGSVIASQSRDGADWTPYEDVSE